MEVYTNLHPRKVDVSIQTPSDAGLTLRPGQCVAGSHYKKFAGPHGPLTVENRTDIKPIATADRADISHYAHVTANNPEVQAAVAARVKELEAATIEAQAQEIVSRNKREKELADHPAPPAHTPRSEGKSK